MNDSRNEIVNKSQSSYAFQSWAKDTSKTEEFRTKFWLNHKREKQFFYFEKVSQKCVDERGRWIIKSKSDWNGTYTMGRDCIIFKKSIGKTMSLTMAQSFERRSDKRGLGLTLILDAGSLREGFWEKMVCNIIIYTWS